MAGKKQYPLSIVLKTVDKSTASIRRVNDKLNFMGKTTDKLRSKFKLLSKELGMANMAKKIGGAAKQMAAFGAAGAAAGVAFLKTFNDANVKTERLAKSVGLNVRTLEALGGAVKSAGFDYEHIVDLAEEMNNKIGESVGLKEVTGPVKESLHILGINFQKLRKMAPEEQFREIVDAALELEDAQAASSAVDILMGGEANKVLGLLRETGQTFDELIATQDKYNFRTEEGREGAKQFTDAMNFTQMALGSLGAELAGVSGGALAGLITQFNEWLVINKTDIALGIREFATALKDGVVWIVQNKEAIAELGGTLLTIGKVLLGLKLATVVLAIAGAFKTLGLLLLTNPIGLTLTAIAVAGALIYSNWDSIAELFRDVAGALGMMWDIAKKFSMDKLNKIAGFFGFGGGSDAAGAGPGTGQPPVGAAGAVTPQQALQAGQNGSTTNNAAVRIEIEGLRPGDAVTSKADGGMPFQLNEGYAMVTP